MTKSKSWTVTPWTPKEDALLIDSGKAGFTDRIIAARLGRTVAAVAFRSSVLRRQGRYVSYGAARFRDAEPVVAAVSVVLAKPMPMTRDERILAALATGTNVEVAERLGVRLATVAAAIRRAKDSGVTITRLNNVAPNRRAWTAEDDARLLALHDALVSDAEYVAVMGRTMSSCYTRLSRLKAKGARVINPRQWSDDQADTLVEMYEAGAKVTEIAAAVGRSPNAVDQRIAWFIEDGTLESRRGSIRRATPTYDPLLSTLRATYGEGRSA